MTRPASRRRIAGLLGVVALAAAGLALVAGPTRAAAAPSAAPSARTPFVQEHCPGTISVYPPLGAPGAASSNFYGVALASQIVGGTLHLGTNTLTTGLSATICGLLRFPQLTATIPGTACTTATEATGCISFGEASTSIEGAVDLPTTFTPGPTVVTVDRAAAPGGGLSLTITTQVTTHVLIAKLGIDCSVGPITVSLTTGTSGPLQGQPVTGPITLAGARIVGATFAVPVTRASRTCPSGLVPATNRLVGLPAAAGVGRFTAPLTLSNSLQ